MNFTCRWLCTSFCLALPVLGQGSSPQAPSRLIRNLEAGKAQTIVVFGTSLSANGAWVGLLEACLKGRFPGLTALYNESGSGHSSAWALLAVRNVTRHKPDAVIIEFAINDAYYPERDGFKEGVPVTTSKINLNKLIDSIWAVNPSAEIFPQTMDLPLGPHRVRRPLLEQYYEGYREVAMARNLTLIDHAPVWKSILDFDTSFYLAWVPDSIHPGAQASGAITLPGVLSALTGARLQLTSPVPQAAFTEGAIIGIHALATSPASRVDFYQGVAKIGTDVTFPHAFDWKGAATGRYLIMANLMQGETPVAVSHGVIIRVSKPSAVGRSYGPGWTRVGEGSDAAVRILPDGRTRFRRGSAWIPGFAEPGRN